jgi:hypothetical protein
MICLQTIKKWNDEWKKFVLKNRTDWIFEKDTIFINLLEDFVMIDIKQTNTHLWYEFKFQYKDEIIEFERDVFGRFDLKSKYLQLSQEHLKDLNYMFIHDFNTPEYISDLIKEKKNIDYYKRLENHNGQKIVSIEKLDDGFLYILDNGESLKLNIDFKYK